MGLSTKTETKFVPRPGGPVKDGATSGDIIESQKVVWTEDEPKGSGIASRPPSADVELGPFGKKFLGFGLILLGLWMWPATGSEGEEWIIPGLLLTLGLIGLTKGAIESWGTSWHPFENVRRLKGAALRLAWAFRPRIWMLLWAAIILGLVWVGSPHLRIQYGPWGCDYFGLNGWETYGTGGNCPLFKEFPLRFNSARTRFQRQIG